jgi:hypothetical protein
MLYSPRVPWVIGIWHCLSTVGIQPLRKGSSLIVRDKSNTHSPGFRWYVKEYLVYGEYHALCMWKTSFRTPSLLGVVVLAGTFFLLYSLSSPLSHIGLVFLCIYTKRNVKPPWVVGLSLSYFTYVTYCLLVLVMIIVEILLSWR